LLDLNSFQKLIIKLKRIFK